MARYPTYISKSTVASNSAAPSIVASASLSYMGSIQAGDLLFIAAMDTAPGLTTGSVSPPAGWSSLGGSSGFSNSVPNYAGNADVFYKVATGSESGSVNVTSFADIDHTLVCQMYQFRSDNANITIETFAKNLTGNGNTTLTFSTMAINGPFRTLVGFSLQVGSAPSTPTGYTNKATDTSLGISLRCETLENVGTDGSVTATGGSTSGWITVHFSLHGSVNRSFIVN